MIRFCAAAALLFFCAAPARAADGPPQAPGPTLEKIADGAWIHKSWKDVAPYGVVLSQGMVLKTAAGILLVDTAWNNQDTEELLSLIEAETGEPPFSAVVTHAHADKMGGMQALKDAGVSSFALTLTNDDAAARGLIPASLGVPVTPSGVLLATEEVVVFHPGAGHTRDNIVVYFAPAQILFGGCLIRPGESGDLGNTGDAVIPAWAESVHRVAESFPDARIVVPSHGAAGGRELLDHTIALADAAARAAQQ